MKRKIIALLLTMVLSAVALFGCGSEANYFTELKETVKHIGNTTESTIKLKIPKEAFVAPNDMPVDVTNGLDVNLKLKAQADDDGNSACVVDVMLNGQDEYATLTTIVKEGNYLYVQTDSIISFLKEMGLDPKGETEAQFKQLGIEKAAKVDIKQACKILDIEYDEDTFNLEKYKGEIGEYIDEMVDLVEDDFKNLSSKEGDDYVLKLDKNNILKAGDDVCKFIDEDLKDAYDITYALVKEIAGEKTAKNFPKYKDVEKKAKDFKKEIQENRKDAANKMGDCVIKSAVNSDEKKIDFGIENLHTDDYDMTVVVDTKGSNEDVDIKSLIPKDAVDITALLNQMVSMAQSSGANTIQ